MATPADTHAENTHEAFARLMAIKRPTLDDLKLLALLEASPAGGVAHKPATFNRRRGDSASHGSRILDNPAPFPALARRDARRW